LTDVDLRDILSSELNKGGVKMKPIRIGWIFSRVIAFFCVLAAVGLCALQLFVLSKPVIQKRFFVSVAEGHSMEPNFHNRDVVVLRRIPPAGGQIERGDVVVIEGMNYKWNGKKMIPMAIMKRIIALPGEVVMGYRGKIFIATSKGRFRETKDEFVQLPSQDIFFRKLHKNEFYVLGDNRRFSLDSRVMGPIPRSDITAIEVFRLDDGPIATLLYDAME
jgi:signal peptidase I